MNYAAGQEYLKSKTKQELIDAYIIEYLEWKKTGVLPDGLIRTLYETICDGDEYVSVTFAENMFNERLAELYYLENNNNFSREEALQLMIDGYKITHRFFGSNEYIYMIAQNIFSEEGYDCGTVTQAFWHSRGGRPGDTDWLSGWRIFK